MRTVFAPKPMMGPIPRILLLSALCLTAAAPSRACMNDYRPNVAAMERSRSLLDQLTKHELKEPWPERRDRLRQLLAEGGDFRVKNDLATTLAHTGEVAESVKLLEEIEAEKPGLYSTAANLGTAYELSGDDRKALEWIRKGIERNPDAHDGSEWLHVRILEAKLALAEDKDWLKTNSISGVMLSDLQIIVPSADGREEKITLDRKIAGSEISIVSVGNRGEKLTLEQVKNALIYQLHERLQFVQPPDVVVGALLLDLGELVGKERAGIGSASGIAGLASSYLEQLPKDHPLTDRAIVLLMTAEEGSRIPTRHLPLSLGADGVIFLLLLCGLLSYLVIKIKRRLERQRAPVAVND